MSNEEIIPTIFRYLDEIRARAVRALVPFGILFVIFVVFKLEFIPLFGYQIPILYPSPYQNIGAQFIHVIENHVLPPQTEILILKPTDGVVADLYSAMFLALFISMPAIVFQVAKFLGPALKPTEKIFLKSVTLPASGLFAAGALMGILWIAPELFFIFYQFDIGLGAQSTMDIMNFVSFFLLYVLTFGISFEVPVFMVGLTRAGLVTSDYWMSHWRYAVVAALVFGMIFSPGVIGFTMMVMAIPMVALYFGGVYFARRAERKKKQEESKSVSEAL